MQTNQKDRAEGPFHKLKTSFREIFGKSSDTSNLKASAPGDKMTGSDHEKGAASNN